MGPGAAAGVGRVDRREVAALLRDRVLDPELCALLWLLLEARTPVIVVGRPGSGRRRLLRGLAALLPADAVVHAVGGAGEDFGWLPEAAQLGWRRGGDSVAHASASFARPATGVLMVHHLGDAAAGGPTGERARVIIRALALGYGLLATAPGDGLDGVLDLLHAPPIEADEAERSRLGVILVMGPPGTGAGSDPAKVVAAHYVRPIALDTHGHVQRLSPAVLATWNDAANRWDHFAWGVMPDLAGRTGRRPIEFEREQAHRASLLRDLAAAAG
jgi:hypothetical protein